MKKELTNYLNQLYQELKDYKAEAEEYLALPLIDRDPTKELDIKLKLFAISVFEEQLTPEEQTIWALRQAGLQYKEIAKEMKLTQKDALRLGRETNKKFKQAK